MKLFSQVRGLKPGRSKFNLSHSRLLNCYHGQLIPIMTEEVVPGDVWKIGNEIVARLMPLVAPILHEINIFVHYFFVPYRIIWPEPDGWETFITGGPQGTSEPSLPRWTPTTNTKYSLWDYLGFPVGIIPAGALPLAFPQYSYNMIWNEYYRDQNLQTETALTNENILKRGWEKDYFTSSLPWQQRGVQPAFPISGIVEVDGQNSNILLSNTSDATGRVMRTNTTGNVDLATSPNSLASARWSDPSLEVDLSNAVTFNISDLRLATQIQKFLERNARTGARYIEFLKAHFAVSPTDARLQRPEFIGGTKASIMVSEVLQTSGSPGDTNYTPTPQGNMAGHGISATANRVRGYRVPEFGLIMGILSIMPRSAYSQGIERQWLRNNRYDYYFPEFSHLSEQPVIRAELYASAIQADNQTLFGYQGRYSEMRARSSRAVADMAINGTLSYWTLSREFATPPALNASFIECDGSSASQTRIFAAGNTEPPYIVHVGNKVVALRPMPKNPEPGLLDHF